MVRFYLTQTLLTAPRITKLPYEFFQYFLCTVFSTWALRDCHCMRVCVVFPPSLIYRSYLPVYKCNKCLLALLHFHGFQGQGSGSFQGWFLLNGPSPALQTLSEDLRQILQDVCDFPALIPHFYLLFFKIKALQMIVHRWRPMLPSRNVV